MRLPKLMGMALLAGVGLGACAHTKGAAESAVENDDEEIATEVQEHHRHHHRGGVTQFVAMSLDTLGADDAERPQIEKLQRELNLCLAPSREAEKHLMITSAEGITAGSLAANKMDEEIALLNASASTVYDCSVDALNQLHAMLSPAERSVISDKLEAHWEIWRQVNDEAEAGDHGKGSRLNDLDIELGLSTDQVDRISAALKVAFAAPSTWEVKKADAQVKAFADAFEKPEFDAKSVTPDASGRFTAHGANRMALFYETVTPFLNPEQRTALAGLIREHANHPTTVSAK